MRRHSHVATSETSYIMYAYNIASYISEPFIICLHHRLLRKAANTMPVMNTQQTSIAPDARYFFPAIIHARECATTRTTKTTDAATETRVGPTKDQPRTNHTEESKDKSRSRRGQCRYHHGVRTRMCRGGMQSCARKCRAHASITHSLVRSR